MSDRILLFCHGSNKISVDCEHVVELFCSAETVLQFIFQHLLPRPKLGCQEKRNLWTTENMPCQKTGAFSNSIVTVCKITLKIELLFICYYSVSLLFILFLQCPVFRKIYAYNVPHLREQVTSEEWENRTQSMYNTSDKTLLISIYCFQTVVIHLLSFLRHH